MLTTARIIVRGDQAHAVVPYEMRHVAKSFGARWEPVERTWKVPTSRVEALAGALRNSGLIVYLTHQDGTRWTPGSRPAPKTATPPCWADELLRKAASTPDLPARIHRALTKVLHPDAGGCPALMAELNIARDRMATR